MNLRTVTSLSLLLPLLAGSALPLQAQEKLTPAEMLKRLQEQNEEENNYEEEAFVWPSELPTDMPLYPGLEHKPVKILDGYYRFNIHAPTSDRKAIIETFREEAKKKGWTAKLDQQESVNIHTFQFTKGNANLIVKVSNDGDETKMVFFEFMTDEFMEKARNAPR